MKRGVRKKFLLLRYLIFIIISIVILTIIYIVKSIYWEVNEENIQPSLQYIISGCQKEETRGVDKNIEIKTEVDSIILNQNLNYVCCANITIDWSKEGNSINITEKNTGEICKCICDYNINAMIGPLQTGAYNVKLYGVEFNGSGADLLAQEKITIKRTVQLTECESDKDCIKIQTTCCPCSAGGEETCVVKSKAEELKAKDCSIDLICTALYNCKIEGCICKAGKCEAVATEEKNTSKLANPASVYCKEQGYNLEIRSDAQGNQYGVCIFPDGSECEEWAYYNRSCRLGQK